MSLTSECDKPLNEGIQICRRRGSYRRCLQTGTFGGVCNIKYQAFVTLLLLIVLVAAHTIFNYNTLQHSHTKESILRRLAPTKPLIAKQPKPKITKAKTDRFNQKIPIAKGSIGSRKPPKEDNMACHIPHVNLKSPSIKGFISYVHSKPNCPKENLLYDFDYKRSLLVKQSLPNGTHPAWSNCCYRAVFRASNKSDNVERFSECYPLRNSTLIAIPTAHEFVTVFCDSLTNSTIQSKMVQAFAIAPLKPEVEALRKVKSSRLKDKDSVNLVILGWDAVSHMNMKRTLPKVRKFLVEDLSAFWFDGYGKVGDNTYPNIVAATTGHSRYELEANCSKTKFFDDCPFFWYKFAEAGYLTSFAEDEPHQGCFTWQKNGFGRQPVDYYFRPLARVAERHIGNDKRGNTLLCYGPVLTIQVLLNYMKSLAVSMGKERRYAQLVWSTALTHDYLTLGSLGEEAVLEYMHWMQSEGHLNSSVFVFMSDHGIRYGAIRDTPQGKIEDNMPFLYFVFPDWMKKKYRLAIKNFGENRARLTTPFDTHETWMDLLDMTNIEDRSIISKTSELQRNLPKMPRGISLFLPIPKSRTCADAGIDIHWCICDLRQTVPLDSVKVRQAANFAVFALNTLVAKHEAEKCAYLTLKSITSAQVIRGTDIFELGFVTSPGDGSFDATVIRNEKGKWRVSGTVSRTNLYGNQSYCVEDKDMKNYCYCLK